MTLASEIEVAAQAWVVVLSASLFIISIAAYRRSGKRRVLGLTLAFAFFLVKGLLATLSLYQGNPIPWAPLSPVLLDTGVLVSIYLATLRSR